jgi:hypothetical protein
MAKHLGVKVAAGIGVALALAGHSHHGHGLTAVLDSIQAPPSGAAYGSREAWARAFLRAIPEPRTACNRSAVVAWETAEGGGFGNQAAHDPLNVNPGPGAGWPGYPATGAWAFPDDATGITYTVRTIRNGNYGGILSALSAGDDAQAVCDAIMASPWAASHYSGSLTAAC